MKAKYKHYPTQWRASERASTPSRANTTHQQRLDLFTVPGGFKKHHTEWLLRHRGLSDLNRLLLFHIQKTPFYFQAFYGCNCGLKCRLIHRLWCTMDIFFAVWHFPFTDSTVNLDLSHYWVLCKGAFMRKHCSWTQIPLQKWLIITIWIESIDVNNSPSVEKK